MGSWNMDSAATLESNMAGLHQLRKQMPHDSTILQKNSHTSPQGYARSTHGGMMCGEGATEAMEPGTGTTEWARVNTVLSKERRNRAGPELRSV